MIDCLPRNSMTIFFFFKKCVLFFFSNLDLYMREAVNYPQQILLIWAHHVGADRPGKVTALGQGQELLHFGAFVDMICPWGEKGRSSFPHWIIRAKTICQVAWWWCLFICLFVSLTDDLSMGDWLHIVT